MLSVRLENTSNGSFKFYGLSIATVAGGHELKTEYGRIGGTSNHGSAGTFANQADAMRELEKVAKSKVRKGYVETERTDAAGVATTIPKPAASMQDLIFQIDLQLLAPSSVDSEALIADPAYMMQEKHDGERCPIGFWPGEALATNKKGKPRIVPTKAVELSKVFNFTGETVIDCEVVGETIYVFDLLKFQGEDIRQLPFRSRYAKLEQWIREVGDYLVLSHATTFTASKRRTYEALKAGGAEGVVFKRGSAAYIAGISKSDGDALKVKFVESATVRVCSVHPTKRSVGIEVHDGQTWIDVGNVSIPPNREVPAVSALVEVIYLYLARQGGSLYQPVYKGERDDVSVDDCTLAQIKIKGEGRQAA